MIVSVHIFDKRSCLQKALNNCKSTENEIKCLTKIIYMYIKILWYDKLKEFEFFYKYFLKCVIASLVDLTVHNYFRWH